MATGDFNRDGKLDLAVSEFVNKSPTGSHVVIFLGDGTGNFTRAAELTTSPQPSDLAVVDLNGDGFLDVIAMGGGSENVAGLFVNTFLGDGTGKFSLYQTTDLGLGSLAGKVALADFNEDGKVDLAFPVATSQSDFKSTTTLIFLGDGNSGFNAAQPLTTGQEPHSAFTADFNSDGHFDLAVTNRTDATLSIFLGNGDGTFVNHATVPIPNLPAP